MRALVRKGHVVVLWPDDPGDVLLRCERCRREVAVPPQALLADGGVPAITACAEDFETVHRACVAPAEGGS